jgi:hypothetical protein
MQARASTLVRPQFLHFQFQLSDCLSARRIHCPSARAGRSRLHFLLQRNQRHGCYGSQDAYGFPASEFLLEKTPRQQHR